MGRPFGNGSNSPVQSEDTANEFGEKDIETGIEPAHAVARSPDGATSATAGVDSVNQRNLLMKIDFRVIPVLSVCYLLAFLDRTNISNARLFNMEADLHLKGNQFNTALVVFFAPYILFEIPSNIILKRLKPHVWLSLLTFLFGLITICQGLTSNFGGLVAARFFLGLCEAGMFPGSFYLISMWYTRPQAQKRFTFFFASTTLAGAFGGLLASAIGKMNGIRGYHGWRWIFILEGILSCVIALILFFAIPDFPEEAKWLSEAEREFHQRGLRADVGKSALARRIQPCDVFNCLRDPRILLGGFMYFGMLVPAYGYAYFAPTIIKSYGYGAIHTQLLSVPPWAAAFVFSMIMATASDRLRHRATFIVTLTAVAMAGFIILMKVHHNRHLEYGALFLVTCGTYSAAPMVICWYTMNLGGHRRRSIGSAWQIGFGNIGGIVASYAVTSDQAKTFYHKGYSICLGFLCLSVTASLLYLVFITYQNRRREQSAGRTVETDEDKSAELGDLDLKFRYMI